MARESTDSGWHSLYISRPPSKAAPCYRCTGTMHFLPPRRPPFFQRFILFSVLSLVVFFSPSLPPSLSSLIPLITAPFVPGWMQPCTAASTTMERATQNVINIEIERSRRGSSTRPAINLLLLLLLESGLNRSGISVNIHCDITPTFLYSSILSMLFLHLFHRIEIEILKFLGQDRFLF